MCCLTSGVSCVVCCVAGCVRCVVQGCTVMPSDAINPETPAKQGSVVEIQCQTDTEYDSCIFTHTNPFYVGQNIQQDTIVSV